MRSLRLLAVVGALLLLFVFTHHAAAQVPPPGGAPQLRPELYRPPPQLQYQLQLQKYQQPSVASGYSSIVFRCVIFAIIALAGGLGKACTREK
jgi:hypothetical protein